MAVPKEAISGDHTDDRSPAAPILALGPPRSANDTEAPAPGLQAALGDPALTRDIAAETPGDDAADERRLPRVLTPEELAGLLRLRPRSVYEAIARGEIPGVRRIGRQIRIDRDSVLDWLAHGQGRVSRSSRR
jgi:excisionase family DNA binding protein